MNASEYHQQGVVTLYLPMIRTLRTPVNRSRTGYGSRLPTSLAVNLDGRMHRVYCGIYSNIGSCFIEKGGFRFYVSETSITEETA
jgi:hypothetical protein